MYCPLAYYGRKRKRIGRPPGGHSNLENGQKKPGKKKNRQVGMITPRKESPVLEETKDNVDDDKVILHLKFDLKL